MVETYEVEPGSFKDGVRHPTLAEASAALPSGSYTTLRTYGRVRVVRLEQHVRRLLESLGSPATLDTAFVQGALATAIERAGHPESRLRLTFAPPRLYVTVERFEPLPASAYQDGARCVLVDVHRDRPRAKDTRFLATAARSYAALPAGIQEGLMLAPDDGAILEGLSSNFFAVLDGALRTEEERVLHGVTRALVLELAGELLPVRLEPVRVGMLGAVSEAFVTSVSREILPVVEIDGRGIGAGRPGPRTRELIRRFAELVQREAKPLIVHEAGGASE